MVYLGFELICFLKIILKYLNCIRVWFMEINSFMYFMRYFCICNIFLFYLSKVSGDY